MSAHSNIAISLLRTSRDPDPPGYVPPWCPVCGCTESREYRAGSLHSVHFTCDASLVRRDDARRWGFSKPCRSLKVARVLIHALYQFRRNTRVPWPLPPDAADPLHVALEAELSVLADRFAQAGL